MKFVSITFICFFLSIYISAQQALNFDGVDDYISTNVFGVSSNSARTIEARIRTTANALPVSSGGTGQKVIADWGTFVNGARSTFNVLWGNALRFEIGGGGVSGSIPVNDGQWHHVACVIDPSAPNNVMLYVDGVLDASGNLSINTGLSNQITIGRRVDNVNSFDGDIDEVRVWNIARSQADIQADMMNELCTFPSSLILYCPLNQGAVNASNSNVNTAFDYSNSQGTCTLNNFALSGNTSNWTNGFAHGAGFVLSPVTTVAACGSYFWPLNNQFYPSSTVAQTVVNSTTGCASIETLNLTINQNSSSSTSVSECTSYTWLQTNQIYTTSGAYTDTLVNTVGCDSVITLNLTITGPTSTTDNIAACEQYTWPANGQTYTSSTTDNITLQSTQGCDSTVFLMLTLSDTNAVTQNVSSCGTYFWDATGIDYTSSGSYTTTLSNQNGCDSTITLNLTVVPFDNAVTTVNETTLSANQNNAQYQWIDCATNLPVAGETNQTFVVSMAGQYAVIITVGACSDTSACINLNTASVEIEDKKILSLYPNPSNYDISIYGLGQERSSAQILNVSGETVLSKGLSASDNRLDISTLPTGLYFVQIETEKGIKEVLRFNKID